VRTTDGRRHLVYEIELTNTSARTLRVDRIASRDADTKELLRSWVGGSQVSSVMQKPAVDDMGNPSVEATDTLEPAETGTAFLNVPLDRGVPTPAQLIHRIDVTLTPPPTGIEFDGHLRHVIPTPVVHERAIELGRPLVGGRYLDGNGCCDASPHTRALLAIDTTSYLSPGRAQSTT
jgi:hypothetical protein